MGTDYRPVRRGKLDQRDLASSQALLVPDVAITCDQDFETSFFGSADQFAVLDRRPSHAAGWHNLISLEGATKPERGILVE
jgi:hypothetical protein